MYYLQPNEDQLATRWRCDDSRQKMSHNIRFSNPQSKYFPSAMTVISFVKRVVLSSKQWLDRASNVADIDESVTTYYKAGRIVV